MKNYLSTLFFAFLLSLNLLGQNENDFQFGISINPKYASPILENTKLSEAENTFNYSLSADLFFPISKRIEIKTGVSLSQMRFKQRDYGLRLGCDIDPVSGIDQFNSYLKEDYQLYFLGVPLDFRFKFGQGKNLVYWKLGGEVLYKVFDNNNTFLIECGMDERETNWLLRNNPNNLIFKLRSGLGFETKFVKSAKLYFEPQVEYMLNSYFDNSGFAINRDEEVNFIEIGLLVGLKF